MGSEDNLIEPRTAVQESTKFASNIIRTLSPPLLPSFLQLKFPPPPLIYVAFSLSLSLPSGMSVYEREWEREGTSHIVSLSPCENEKWKIKSKRVRQLSFIPKKYLTREIDGSLERFFPQNKWGGKVKNLRKLSSYSPPYLISLYCSPPHLVWFTTLSHPFPPSSLPPQQQQGGGRTTGMECETGYDSWGWEWKEEERGIMGSTSSFYKKQYACGKLRSCHVFSLLCLVPQRNEGANSLSYLITPLFRQVQSRRRRRDDFFPFFHVREDSHLISKKRQAEKKKAKLKIPASSKESCMCDLDVW